MTSLAITFVLISAGMHVVRDLFTKSSGDKIAFLWLFAACGLVIMFPVLAYSISQNGFPTANQILLMFLVGIIHCVYAYFLMKAYEKGDLSHVYPITRSAPALVLIFAILLFEESVSWRGVTGIMLVVLGAYCINMKKWSFGEFFEPVRSLRDNASTRWAVLTMLSVTVYSIIDKKMVEIIPPMTLQYGYDITIVLLFTIFITTTKRWPAVKKEWKERKIQAAANGFLAFAGYNFILLAFQMANVSYVTGLRQISVVFAVLLGGHLLNEKHKSVRFTSACIIFIGAMFISIA